MFEGVRKLFKQNAGNFDGHAHVFEKSLPLATPRRYSPQYDAPLKSYIKLLQENQLDGALLVQPSFLGSDNSFLLNALENHQQHDGLVFQGVVVVSPETLFIDLERMNSIGVIGARLNLLGQNIPDLSRLEWQQWFSSLNDLEWHVELHIEGSRLPEILPRLVDLSETVVLDHFGLPATQDPLQCDGLKAILHAAHKNIFVKTSAPYRIFPNLPLHHAIAETAKLYEWFLEILGPDQLVWGSDWPWTQHENKYSFSDTMGWLHSWNSMGLTDT